MAKASTLRTLSDDQLLDELDDAKKELFNLRFAFATGQLDNSAQMSATKRDIARIHTVLREREIAAAEMLADPQAPRSAAPPTGTQTGDTAAADGAKTPATTPVDADATAEDPAVAEEAATSPAATDPSTAESASTDLPESEPTASAQAESEPSASAQAESEPAATDRVTADRADASTGDQQ